LLADRFRAARRVLSPTGSLVVAIDASYQAEVCALLKGLVAARQLVRRYLGIELCEATAALARQRLEKTPRGGRRGNPSRRVRLAGRRVLAASAESQPIRRVARSPQTRS
jgi:hypothetical protein